MAASPRYLRRRALSRKGFMVRQVLAASAWLLFAGGCATAVTFHATGLTPPICKASPHKENALVYWSAAWRSDPKEVPRREAIAAQGIADFLGSNPCFSALSVSRTIAGRDVLLLSDTEILAAASANADRIFVIRIEELGPNLTLYLSPLVWATENEVVFRVRCLNPKTGGLDCDVSVRWTRGGPFALLGTNSLPPDVSGALNALFLGDGSL